MILPDYRKAPTHKFPAAPDDCLEVLRYVASENGASTLRVDAARIAVGGDSAGGNLSAVLAQDALKAGISLKHQLLIYPVTSARCHWFKSWRENQNQPILSTRSMLWFWREYRPFPFNHDLRAVFPNKNLRHVWKDSFITLSRNIWDLRYDSE